MPEAALLVATRRAASWAGRHPTHYPQMNETNRPCAACGAVLTEPTVGPGGRSLTTRMTHPVRPAEYPSCEGRCYPQEPLEQLTDRPAEVASPEGTE